MGYLWKLAYLVQADELMRTDGVESERVPRPSHNTLLPVRYFVQIVIWVVNDGTPSLSEIVSIFQFR